MRFPIKKGVREVKGDQVDARECYIALLKGEPALKESITIDSLEVWDEGALAVAGPRGELEDVTLNTDTPEGVTRVRADLPEEFKAQLRDFLIRNRDVLAWTHEDMPGINPPMVMHRLNVDRASRPVKHKKRNFALEWN